MRRILTFLLPFIISVPVAAQVFEIGASAGMGWYAMKDLKEINQRRLVSLPFHAEITEEFPPYIQYRASAIVHIKDIYNLGLIYTHNSTGSRISSKDYSGSYTFDNTLTGNSIGLLAGYKLARFGDLRVDLDATFGAIFTHLDNTVTLAVADTVLSDTYSAGSVSFIATPELNVTYAFPYISAGMFIGYAVNVSNDETVSNWSGLRIGITLAAHFPPKQVKPVKQEERK